MTGWMLVGVMARAVRFQLFCSSSPRVLSTCLIPEIAINYRVAQNKRTPSSLFKFVVQHWFKMSQNDIWKVCLFLCRVLSWNLLQYLYWVTWKMKHWSDLEYVTDYLDGTLSDHNEVLTRTGSDQSIQMQTLSLVEKFMQTGFKIAVQSKN